MRRPRTCFPLLAGLAGAAACAELPAEPPTPPRFIDVTDGSGITGVAATGELEWAPGAGVAAADLDGDGLAELVIGHGEGGTRLYGNLGGLAFADRTEAGGLDPAVQTLTPLLADVDGDGDDDLVLGTTGPVRLHENRGGVFTDVTAAAGLPSGWTRVALAGDFDGDGALDLFLSVADAYDAPARHLLLANLGGFRFADVSAAAGLTGSTISHAAGAVDYDGDGDLDLLVTTDSLVLDDGEPEASDHGRDLLFRNDGAGAGDYRFTEVAEAAGLATQRSSMGIEVADFDGDGSVDFYVSDFGENDLLAQVEPGRFVERSAELGIGADRIGTPECSGQPTLPECLLVSWGAVGADLDHDGHRDLLVINGQVMPWDWGPQPVSAFTGGPDGFAAADFGFGELFGRGALPADLDGDGDLDVLVTLAQGRVLLFANRTITAERRWLQVSLRGRVPPIGARVRVTTSTGRTLEQWIGAGGGMRTAPPLVAHFGLGAAEVDELEVVWPDGAIRRYGGVDSNRLVQLVEDDPL